jgi:hypothetical protein
MRLADPPGGDGFGDRGVCRIEAAVEADLERHPVGLDRIQPALELVEEERHRLLAEHRLARLCGGDHQVHVGVGAGADGHGVDVGREHLLDAGGERHAQLVGDGRGTRCVDVVDDPHRRTGHPPRQQLGMHPADAPDSDDPDADGPRPTAHAGIAPTSSSTSGS